MSFEQAVFLAERIRATVGWQFMSILIANRLLDTYTVSGEASGPGYRFSGEFENQEQWEAMYEESTRYIGR
jgi:hypothetical protein